MLRICTRERYHCQKPKVKTTQFNEQRNFQLLYPTYIFLCIHIAGGVLTLRSFPLCLYTSVYLYLFSNVPIAREENESEQMKKWAHDVYETANIKAHARSTVYFVYFETCELSSTEFTESSQICSPSCRTHGSRKSEAKSSLLLRSPKLWRRDIQWLVATNPMRRRGRRGGARSPVTRLSFASTVLRDISLMTRQTTKWVNTFRFRISRSNHRLRLKYNFENCLYIFIVKTWARLCMLVKFSRIFYAWLLMRPAYTCFLCHHVVLASPLLTRNKESGKGDP